MGRLQRRDLPVWAGHDGWHHLHDRRQWSDAWRGYLARGFGLSLDNLVSADVVTAEGKFLITSEKENEDLFWAIRGGGGNFGVLTSLEFRLHPVKDIYGGPMFFELEHIGDVLRFYREYIKDAPEEMGCFPAF